MITKHVLQFLKLSILLLLSSCSSGILDAINPMSEPAGIHTDVQVGKENTLTHNKALAQVSNDEHRIINTDNIDALHEERTYTTNVSYGVILLMCLGWAFIFTTPRNVWLRWRNRATQHGY